MIKLSPFFMAFLGLIITLVFSCKPDDETPMEEPQECYRCTFNQLLPNDCSSAYVEEICVIGPHDSSLQLVLEVTEICDGEIVNVAEEINFLEAVLEELIAAGAECEEF